MLKYLCLLVFVVGTCGFICTPYTLLTNFVAVELMLLSAAAAGTAIAADIGDLDGQYYSLVILTVAAAESALGLAILVQFYRIRGDIDTLSYTHLKA